MLKKGKKLFFVEDGYVHDGIVEEIAEDGSFSLEGYGCCCEGACRISAGQLGKWVFEEEEDAKNYMQILSKYDDDL